LAEVINFSQTTKKDKPELSNCWDSRPWRGKCPNFSESNATPPISSAGLLYHRHTQTSYNTK